MKKIAYGIKAILLLLLFFSNVSRADEGHLTSALDQLIENPNQYLIVHYSFRKWYEYCDIVDIYKGKKDVVVKFKFRGNDTRLTLSKFDEKNASAAGSFLNDGWVTSTIEVQLKFNPDGTANGKWEDFGFSGGFYIFKKEVLETALDKLVNNFNQYKIALITLTGEQVHCDILGVYKEDKDIVLKFKYRGETRLIMNEFDYEHSVVRGKYLRNIVGANTIVPIELIFKADGTAIGKWKTKGIRNKFNIIQQK